MRGPAVELTPVNVAVLLSVVNDIGSIDLYTCDTCDSKTAQEAAAALPRPTDVFIVYRQGANLCIALNSPGL